MYDTPCKPKRPGKLALAAALALLLAGCGAAPSDEAAPAVVVTLPDREGIYQLAADYSLDGEVIGTTEILAAGTVEKAGYKDYFHKTFRTFLL